MLTEDAVSDESRRNGAAAGLGLFTVEQIELARRLKLTGITSDQCAQIFKALDHLDQELAACSLSSQNDASTLSSTPGPNASRRSQSQPVESTYDSAEGIVDCNDPRVTAAVDHLFRRGESAVSEVREFLAKSGISQTSLAKLCGINQPYVSQFLNGGRSSKRVKMTIFAWYAVAKPPDTTDTTFYSEVGNESAAVVDASAKRGRYSFKPMHVSVMEKYLPGEVETSYNTRKKQGGRKRISKTGHPHQPRDVAHNEISECDSDLPKT